MEFAAFRAVRTRTSIPAKLFRLDLGGAVY